MNFSKNTISTRIILHVSQKRRIPGQVRYRIVLYPIIFTLVQIIADAAAHQRRDGQILPKVSFPNTSPLRTRAFYIYVNHSTDACASIINIVY